MSKGEQPTPQPHGDLDYYFKLPAGRSSRPAKSRRAKRRSQNTRRNCARTGMARSNLMEIAASMCRTA